MKIDREMCEGLKLERLMASKSNGTASMAGIEVSLISSPRNENWDPTLEIPKEVFPYSC